MGIKDLDALAKTIKPFRQDVFQTTTQDSGNGVASSSAETTDSLSAENSSNQRQRQKRPDRAVYVPRGRRSQPTPPTVQTSNSGSVPKTLVLDKESVDEISATNVTLSPSQSIDTIELSAETRVTHSKEEHVHNENPPEDKTNSQESPLVVQEEKPPSQSINSATDMTDTNARIDDTKIEHAQNNSDKDFNEEKEFQRASKEINRRNRRIIKQTFDSDVLEINEAPSVTSKQTPSKSDKNVEKKPNLPHPDTQSNESSSTQTKRKEKSSDKTTVNGETDDWESIFDDNGECSDSKLMNEITASVGKVTVSKPKNDYKTYQEPINLEDEEFPHVLEMSNFPVEFKTQDLMMIFVEYKETGFDIKWVDDTHALVVFSSSKIAARALSTAHPFVKLKPLTQATAESRSRAKKSALFLQPYRQRPETCAALARRLVTGALGVRLSTAREEREIERRVLKEAKERKLLAAKLRDEAWEN